ncbi:ABC transporter ATP-binding protein [Streptomyces hygroscopicus subsp. jinggangensis 5008]|nr:ABC transporter ATP-binding protein [Streptomyces hygroscopicus subsp. jinggangensis 5008]
MSWPPYGFLGNTRSDLAVEVDGLVKRFGDRTVIDGVDLQVRQGTVLGVLGPNGAGKTTLVRILSTLAKADSGTALVGGFDVRMQAERVRRSIGLTGQYASVDEQLTGFENLYMIGRLLDLSRRKSRLRAGELLERFSLTEAAGRRVSTYSGGMRRRLDLAAGMIGRPIVLFLDEPTTGLDPHTRNEVWNEVEVLAKEGTAVLLTTQYMEEAERLADELTVIDRGRVIARGSTAQLKSQVGAETLQIHPLYAQDAPSMVACLRQTGVSSAWVEDASGNVLVTLGDDKQLRMVVNALGSADFAVAGLTTRQPSLDDVFLLLTGHQKEASVAAMPSGGMTTAAPYPVPGYPFQPSSPAASALSTPVARLPQHQLGVRIDTPAVPPSRQPPRVAAHMRHTGTLIRRNLLRMKSDPFSMLDSVLMPVIFTVLFVYVFGGAIAGSRAEYIQYMIPGLLGIMSLMLATSVGTGMNTDFQTGLMDRFRTLPIAPFSVLAAKLVAETIRSVLSLSILVNFAMLLGLQVPAGPLKLLAMNALILMFGMSMVWVSMLVGMTMRSAQAAQAVTGLVTVPLQFGSSIFAPVSTMPDWLLSFTRYNPLSALADACRALINDRPAGHSTLVVLIWSLGITMVAAPLALWRFRKKA